MDEILKALLELGVSGAALGVFYLLMKQMMDKHELERARSQEKSEKHVERLVSNFREESKQTREHYEEKVLKVIDG